MQYGAEFHAGSKSEALGRLNGTMCPAPVRTLAVAAIAALDGAPSNIKVSLACEDKDGKGEGLRAIAISVVVVVGGTFSAGAPEHG